MNGRGITCPRYIDDFLLLGPSEKAVQKAFCSAQKILKGLGMRAYDPGSEKAEAGKVEKGFDFLGCTISPGLIQPTRSARQKIARQIRSIFVEARRSASASRDGPTGFIRQKGYAQTLIRLDHVLLGWGHAYAFCNGRQSFDAIDRMVDAEVDAFRHRTDAMLSRAAAAESRRILGVHLLSDTPIMPLPDMSGGRNIVQIQ